MISRTDAEKLNNPDAFLEYIGLQSFNFPENLVEVAGIEPETPCAKSPLSMQDSDFSPEALTEILTEISGTDRQMLSQVVQRWGSLSEELKRAVLRVVG